MLGSMTTARWLDGAYDRVRVSVACGDFPSAVLAVANRDHVLRCEAFGPSDGSYPVSPNSIYLLASVTKPIVATAAMRLVERGLILLHEPIAAQWPEFAQNGKERVTLWHLLTHTSGLIERTDHLASIHADPPLTLREIHAADVANILHRGLDFAPGSAFRYSNSAFRIIAELIERLTGAFYVDYLQDEVFAPLGMADASFIPPESDRVAPVQNFPSPEFKAVFRRAASPAGGLYDSVADLITFGRAFLEGGTYQGYRLLSRAGVDAMTRVQYRGIAEWSPGWIEPISQGLGWMINDGRELEPAGSYRHGGVTGTRLLVDPVNDFVLVFLTNRWGIQTDKRDRIFNAIYGGL